MTRAGITIGIAILVLARAAAAQPDPAFDELEKVLPAGWSLLATGAELVIRHDRPCYLTAPHDAPRAAGGPLVTLELRYRLEPRWTAAQVAAAQATNEALAAELRALAARYRIDAIHRGKAGPAPANADERARLEAYTAAHSRIAARMVKLPRCSLGESSVFDGPDTYAQLTLRLDPPEAIAEAHRVVELVKAHCR
jgi:hypothetical protein